MRDENRTADLPGAAEVAAAAGGAADSRFPPGGPWMQTVSGRRMGFDTVWLDQINIRDIAHALSMQCRFNGHVPRFYSVAEHCVHAADRAGPALKLTALLHDAAEAFTGDVVRPLKRALPKLAHIEARLESAIAKKYGSFWPFPAAVHEIDGRLLSSEAHCFFGSGAVRDWDLPPPYTDWQPRYWEPEVAQDEFLRTFVKLA